MNEKIWIFSSLALYSLIMVSCNCPIISFKNITIRCTFVPLNYCNCIIFTSSRCDVTEPPHWKILRAPPFKDHIIFFYFFLSLFGKIIIDTCWLMQCNQIERRLWIKQCSILIEKCKKYLNFGLLCQYINHSQCVFKREVLKSK